MAFIDDVIDKAQKAGKYVTDKAVDAKDYVTLEYKAVSIRSAINDKYKELGEITYNLAKSGGEDKSAADACIAAIDQKNAELEAVNEQMRKFKKVCPQCNTHADGSAAFCKKCGSQL